MYEHYFKLSARPFQLSPDPRFFFSSKGHKRALAYLRYGVKQGEGFIIVTGDVGTGKTTLVGALFQLLAKEDVVAAQIVTTQMEADDLLRMVAGGFGLPYQDVSKAAMLRGLEEYFRACVQEGKRILLVVDEAQGLPRTAIEELRMLSNFQMNGRALLQSFLLGQREFRITMRSAGFEQLRQRVIAAYHLQPLDELETRGYVEHRLSRAGWRGDPAWREDVFAQIHGFTGGVPRRINTLCDRVMLYCYLEEKHEIDTEVMATVTGDLSEEQALPGPAEVPPVVPSVPGPAASAQAVEIGQQAALETDRLAEVESSVLTLARAMREEIAQLRAQLREREEKDSSSEG